MEDLKSQLTDEELNSIRGKISVEDILSGRSLLQYYLADSCSGGCSNSCAPGCKKGCEGGCVRASGKGGWSIVATKQE